MSVEELITKLQKYPPHFEVQVAVVHPEEDDEIADIVDVTNFIQHKIVNVVLDGKTTAL